LELADLNTVTMPQVPHPRLNPVDGQERQAHYQRGKHHNHNSGNSQAGLYLLKDWARVTFHCRP
jgi:hypothetical protein